jgi:hypothetical protein
MGCDVFANGDEIACKAGDGKVIAAFPDVCLSPPSPPAGPIPIPYPNTSFSRDMQNGSTTVMIKGQEVMLKDQSFYKTAPLGDEAATNGLGASVITHVITGKTYFVAWSMDVQIEGQNVDRHTDLTTSNHASQPGATPPNPNIGAMATAAIEDTTGFCECCGDERHSNAGAMTMDEWYTSDPAGNPLPATDARVVEYHAIMNDYYNPTTRRDPCVCSTPTRLVPSPPCNVFRKQVRREEKRTIEGRWRRNSPAYRAAQRVPPGTPVMHLTPKNAGGCPGNVACDGNLQVKMDLCGSCQRLDNRFGDLQSLNPTLP